MLGLPMVCGAADEEDSEEEELSIEETVELLQAQVSSLTANAQLERGRKIYLRACAPCHGVRGDGKGPAARGFDPAPRNFRRGSFKFRTTVSGALPLDPDLQRTIREGVPGTEMPRWQGVLSDHDIAVVAKYIQTFSPLYADPDSLPLPEDVIEVPEERPFEPSLASIAAGQQIFVDQDCIKCHGESGRGRAGGSTRIASRRARAGQERQVPKGLPGSGAA